MKPNHEMTPRSFLSHGRGWVSMYHAGKNASSSRMYASNYSLLFALELYLKAYITTMDKRYSTEKELKKLGHDLRKLVAVAKTTLPEKYANLLDRFCYLQNTMVSDYPECRYPMLKRGVRQLYGGQEELLSVLKYIERVVKSVSFAEWWERKAQL
ncbi:MAG: hypothetical protein V4702_03685 [Patescibacteria group bacterium]